MTDLNVKKQNSGNEPNALEKRSDPGIFRRGWDPFFGPVMPSDFFSSDPFSWMRRFHEEMDRTLARVFGKESDGEAGIWYPAIEVSERDGHLHVHAELPGLKPEDVKVEVTAEGLVIQGERKYEHEDNKDGVYRSERRYGRFYREIPLPKGAGIDEARATFKDGVLDVALPVPEAKNNRRTIPIQSGSASTAAKLAA
jgi:HSP20 family protein